MSVPAATCARAALPGLALAVAGAGLLALAATQPAWLGTQPGPGLMARLLGMGVLALGGAWAVWCVIRPPAAPPAAAQGERWGGVALLGAVLAFGLALPVLGLVLACGLAGALAAWGAGERAGRALALTTLGLTGLAALIGLTLLPPATPLWPLGV